MYARKPTIKLRETRPFEVQIPRFAQPAMRAAPRLGGGDPAAPVDDRLVGAFFDFFIVKPFGGRYLPCQNSLGLTVGSGPSWSTGVFKRRFICYLLDVGSGLLMDPNFLTPSLLVPASKEGLLFRRCFPLTRVFGVLVGV